MGAAMCQAPGWQGYLSRNNGRSWRHSMVPLPHQKDHRGDPQALRLLLVTWVCQLLLQLGLGGHALGFRGVDNQHDRTCTAEQTPQLAQDVELLLQKVRG